MDRYKAEEKSQGSWQGAMLSGLASLSEHFDAFIIDMWGVIHNGYILLPGVTNALSKLKSQGKCLIILSNAPRRSHEILSRAYNLGLDTELFDFAMSSGEDVWQHWNRRGQDYDPWYDRLGNHVFLLGKEEKQDSNMPNLLKGIKNISCVDSLDQADVVLNIGPSLGSNILEETNCLLEEALERRLPMICCNPDRYVILGHSRKPCAGLFAESYAERGGDVRWHGKPWPGVYRRCLEWLGQSEPKRLLAIGDSLSTDIAGAYGIGIPSALVTTGIHAKELDVVPGELPQEAHIQELLKNVKAKPDYLLPGLVW